MRCDLFPDVKFQDKDLILTGHIKRELYDQYGKNLDLIFEIMKDGTSGKQSKDKRNIKLKTKGGTWELVYVENEGEIILIHLKLRR